MEARRWYSKKVARATVALVGAAVPVIAPRGARVRVLTYHRFGHARRDPFCVEVAAFEQQMAWLAERRLAISLRDVERFVHGAQDLADGSVLVTIDDGCPSVYAKALPVLLRYAIPAALFVPAGELVGADGHSAPAGDDAPDARMTRADLVDVARAGITVGSHAWTHHSLGAMSEGEIRDQLARSRAELEDAVGTPVTAFAYPYGTRADYDERTARLLRETGYTIAFTSQHGAVRPGLDALTLPRVKVEGGEPFWMFPLLSRGALDAWSLVDRTLWRLQASGG